MTARAFWPLLVAGWWLPACTGADEAPRYTIAVNTSGSMSPYSYAGSYQFFRNGERVTRELSDSGSHSVTFEADRLISVRVHGNAPASIYSLAITKNGKVVFESPAMTANQPLIYHMPPGERGRP